MQDFLDSLNGKIKYNYSLKNSNWFKISCTAEYYYSPYSVNDLIFFLKYRPKNTPFFILGAGSNILLNKNYIKGFVIKLDQLNNAYFLSNNDIFVEAGALNITVSNIALKGNSAENKNQSQGGLEFLSGIPGSVGGAITMNAGAFSREFKDICVSVKALDIQGNILEFSNADMGFYYRGNSKKDEQLIFLSSILKGYEDTFENVKQNILDIKKQRQKSQPLKVLTGGSTFANPIDNNPNLYKAWELIDKVGLRGYKIGSASFSEKHCNFLINHNAEATSSDIKKLINEAKKRVKKEFDIDLKEEIIIIE